MFPKELKILISQQNIKPYDFALTMAWDINLFIFGKNLENKNPLVMKNKIKNTLILIMCVVVGLVFAERKGFALSYKSVK